MIFKKLAVQLTWMSQAKDIVKYLFAKKAYYVGGSGKWVTGYTRYEQCSDDDKRYLNAYDRMLYELKAIRMNDYRRYKKRFVYYLTSSERHYYEAARDLLNDEFTEDKEDIEKLIILK